MDDLSYHEIVKEAARSKFRGSQTLKSRTIPRYPDSSEREFKRVTNAYTKILRDTIKEHLPAIMSSLKAGRNDGVNYDDDLDVNKKIRDEMRKAAEEIEQKISKFGLAAFIEKVAKMSRNASIREWKRVVHQTLGINIMDDYYKGEAYAKLLREWVDNNVMKIKSIPTDMLGEMQQIILEAYAHGSSITDIQKAIQKSYNDTKKKAALLARDQISTLNSQFTKLQQTDAGCEEYIWSDSGDVRVRDCHRELNGKTFRWDDPPEMWYMTKERGKVLTGRRCHPGEDYCCRCVAIPKFNIEKLNLPIVQAA